MAPIKLWYNILVSLEYWLGAGHFSSHRLEQYHIACSEDQLHANKAHGNAGDKASNRHASPHGEHEEADRLATKARCRGNLQERIGGGVANARRETGKR
jgi:hypothetical protein